MQYGLLPIAAASAGGARHGRASKSTRFILTAGERLVAAIGALAP
jgi:hypothetical protein